MTAWKSLSVLIVPDAASAHARSFERGEQFEQLIGILLEALAFRVKRRLSSSGTEIDIIAENLVTGELAIIQCKDTKSPLETAVLQQLHSQAVTHGIQVALLYSTAELTPQAKEYLRDKIVPTFSRFRAYGPAEIVELLATSKTVHRLEVIEAFVKAQGLDADSWSLCIYKNRAYWVAPVQDGAHILPSHWVLLQAKGSLVADRVFLDKVEVPFQRRFEEVRSPCFRLPLLNNDKSVAQSWQAPLIVRETGLHSLLAGRPGFLKPSRRLKEFIEDGSSTPHCTEQKSTSIGLQQRSLWDRTKSEVEALIDRIIPDEAKEALGDEEVRLILAGIAQMATICAGEEQRHRLNHTLHALLKGSDQSILTPLEDVDGAMRPVIASAFGVAGHSAREKALGGLLRIAFALILCTRSLPRLACELLDSDFPIDSLDPLFEADEIEIDHNSYRIAITGITESAYGSRGAKLIEDALERLLLALEEDLYLIGIRLFRVEIQIEGEFSNGSIGFRLHNRGVLELLMGKALYDNKLVFVRELIQNAIDASRLLNYQQPGSVTVIMADLDRFFVTVIDHGVGMDRYNIERYLTTIGVSLYRSSDLRAIWSQDTAFVPISRFGIGFLSAFMLGDEVVVRTRMAEMASGIELVMHSATDAFALRNFDSLSPGTSVRVRIATADVETVKENKYRSFVNYIEETFICPPSPIEIIAPSGATTRIERFNCDIVPEAALERLGPPKVRSRIVGSGPKLRSPRCFQSPHVTVAVYPYLPEEKPKKENARVVVTRFGIRVKTATGPLFDCFANIFKDHYVHIDERFASSNISVDRTKLALDEADIDTQQATEAAIAAGIAWIAEDTLGEDDKTSLEPIALSWCSTLLNEIPPNPSTYREREEG